MKLTTALLAIAAVAAAVPESEAYRGQDGEKGPYLDMCGDSPCLKAHKDDTKPISHAVGACGTAGKPCYNVKRAAYLIGEALSQAKDKLYPYGRCGAVNTPYCEEKRQHLESIASHALDTYSGVSGREAVAEVDLVAREEYPDAPWVSKRDASIISNAKKWGRCDPGGVCFKKREAEPEADANFVAHANKWGRVDPGGIGFKKRDAFITKDHYPEGLADFCNYERNHCKSKPDADLERSGLKAGFCDAEGADCEQKRDAVAEADANFVAHANKWGRVDPGGIGFRKREAEPEADANFVAHANKWGRVDPGGIGFKNKREADANFVAHANKWGRVDPGGIGFKNKREAAAEADPNFVAHANKWGRVDPGGIGFKRDAEADPNFVAHANKWGRVDPGGIGFKRDAEADPNFVAHANKWGRVDPGGIGFKRDAEADPNFVAHANKWGRVDPGGIGFKNKRDPEADANFVAHANKWGRVDPGGIGFKNKRDAEADPNFVAHANKWGRVDPGGIGFKRDASFISHANKWGRVDPGGIGFKRDVDEAPQCAGVPDLFCDKKTNATGHVTWEPNQNYLKTECLAEGGECNTLLKIQAAFQSAKKESKAMDGIKDPSLKLAYCDEKGADCSALTQAHLYATKYNDKSAQQAEKECFGSNGPCTLAQRDLDALEKRINAAVAAI